MQYRQAQYTNRKSQHGVVLIVSLILLLSMTILVLSGVQATVFEEKMSGNMRDRSLAFEAAEAALREAESFIDDEVSTLGAFDDDGADGLYDDSVEALWKTVDWTGNDSGNTNKAITAESGLVSALHIKTAPKYIIQHYASITQDADLYNLNNYGQGIGAGELEVFRITARGTGGSDNAVVILQVTYGKLL